MTADLESQARAVGIADIDLLTVPNVHAGYPSAIDEHAVEAAVVDRDPAAPIEPQHHMGARDQWVGDPNVSAQIAADHDVTAGRKCTR